MYKIDRLPIGCDLIPDIKLKIQMPVRNIFDVGANTGQTVKRFSLAFPDAKIYSFEPVAATYSLLKKNTQALANVSCYHEALGEQVGDTEITTYSGKDSLLNSLKNQDPASMKKGGTVETIHVNTGDAFSRKNRIDYIDLLKIDTEGFELEVLKGSADLLKSSKIKAIYCEVGFNRTNKQNTYLNDVLDFLNPYGYEFYGLYDLYNKRLNGGSDYGSVLFVKP